MFNLTRWAGWAALARVTLGSVLLAGLFAADAQADEAERRMPAFFLAGSALNVQVSVLPGGGTVAHSVEEKLPAGWVPSQITLGGVWNPESRAIRWGPFLDNSQRLLTYTVTAPSGPASAATFEGTAVFNDQAVTVSGVSLVAPFPDTLSRVLPFDFEPGVPIQVFAVAKPRAGVQSYAVEEELPQGWTVNGITGDGVFDPVQRKLKWGPFQDHLERTIGYTTLPSQASPDEVTFRAIGLFDMRTVPAVGNSQLRIRARGVVRILPASFTPGQLVPVQINLNPLVLDKVWSVEENIPTGWQFISGDSTLVVDEASRKIKWGPVANAGRKTLSYVLRSPSIATAPVSFVGSCSFDSSSFLVGGDALSQPAVSLAVRSLPANFQLGAPLVATLTVTPLATVQSFSIQETLPLGWQVDLVSDGGIFDLPSRTVRWGPFASHDPKVLTYTAHSPSNSYGSVSFVGTAAFDAQSKDVSGDLATLAVHQITRIMSADFRSGIPGKVVVLNAVPLKGVVSQAVQETIPAGWSPTSISDGGVFVAGDRTIRWGPFFDDSQRNLTYTAVAPFVGEDTVQFSGMGQFDLRAVTAVGPSAANRTLNLPPTVLPVSMAAAMGQTTRIRVETVLAGASDPDSGILSLELPQLQSDTGGAVSLSDGWIYYTPPSLVISADHFTCLVNDGQGGVSSADIEVTISVGDQTVNEEATLSVTFQGTAGGKTLTYGLVSGPTGMTVSPAGLLTWTPTEAQGPSSNPVKVSVSDGTLSVTNSFTVKVQEVNKAPTLAAIATQTVNEESLLSLTLQGGDADLPAQTLTYGLVSGPAGMTLSPAGLLTWTPTEAQGPSSNPVKVSVSDGSLSLTNSFTVNVLEVNKAPTLAAIATQTVNEEALLSLTLQGGDADLPAQTLTYGLVSGPTGMSVSPSGLLTWTPTEAQGSSSTLVKVSISDGTLSVTNSFTVNVLEVNKAPTLAAITTQTVNEESLLSLTLQGSDADLPAQTLTYGLVSGPTGMSVSPSGLLTWTPTEAQGSSSTLVKVSISDGTLSVTNSFTVNVLEVNKAPTLAAITAQTVSEESLLGLTLQGSDADLPAQTLTYGLVSGPTGMSVSPAGLLTWTPSEAQGPSSNPVKVSVSDGTLSVTNGFTVTVQEVNKAPTLAVVPTQTVNKGASLSLALQGSDADLPAQALTYKLVSGPAGVVVSTAGALSWTPTAAQSPSTNDVLVSVNDGVASVTNLFKAIVLGAILPPTAPTLVIRSLQSDGKLALDVAGSLGVVLFVESTSDFTTWTTVQQVIGQGSGVPVRVTVQPGPNIPALFWRVRAGQSLSAPTLAFEPLQADGSLVLVVTGPAATAIFLESSADFTNWSTTRQVTGLGSGIPVKVTVKPEVGIKSRFWRVVTK